MNMQRPRHDIIIETLQQHGIMRSRDLATAGGVSPGYLNRLAEHGELVVVGRGMYSLPGQSHLLTAQHSFAQASAYSKKIVICLLSALRFHDIGTQLPHVLWVAIPTPDRTPKIPDIELQVIRMNNSVLNAGIEEHVIEGQNVRIFSAAKTVADCFRYRSSVGTEAALEALRDGLIKGKVSTNELYEFAVINRVWNIMEPYIEALT